MFRNKKGEQTRQRAATRRLLQRKRQKRDQLSTIARIRKPGKHRQLKDLFGAEEAKKNAGRMGTKADIRYVEASEDYRTLKHQILGRFPGSTVEALGKWTLNGQTLLGPEATVAWMYALTESCGGTIDNRQALGVYGFLSNMTRPTLYPARQLREWSDDRAHGHRVAQLRADIRFLERQASAAIAAFYNALTYVTSYFGWNASVVDALTVRIEKSMPTFFV